MSTAEVSRLTNDVAGLKEAFSDLSKQYRDMKHDNANMAQGINNAQSALNRLEPNLQKLSDGLMGDEELNHDGLFKQVKNHIKNHIDLEKRVSDIEQIKKIEEKLITYKKSLLGIVFGSVGATIILIIKTIYTLIITHGK